MKNLNNADAVLDLVREQGPLETTDPFGVVGLVGRTLGVSLGRARVLLERVAEAGLITIQYSEPRKEIVRVEAVPVGTWEDLEAAIGVTFSNRSLLERAFTHASVIPRGTPGEDTLHYEGLEFLGDSILTFLVKEYIVAHHSSNVGAMTGRTMLLVSNDSLAEVATGLGIVPYLRHAAKVPSTERGASYKADLVEALIAAIYLDQGMEATRRFVFDVIIEPNLEQLVGVSQFSDASPRNKLDDLLRNKGEIQYTVLARFGSGNNRIITVGIVYNRAIVARGRGKNFKKACDNAAQALLDKLAADD